MKTVIATDEIAEIMAASRLRFLRLAYLSAKSLFITSHLLLTKQKKPNPKPWIWATGYLDV